MADQAKIIDENPIGSGLDAFRASFRSLCQNRSLDGQPDALGHLIDGLEQADAQKLAISLVSALLTLRASSLLPSRGSGTNLSNDLLRFIAWAASAECSIDRIKPLLTAALDGSPYDRIWSQTPWSRNTSGSVNSSESRSHMDTLLREELGAMYVGLPRFRDTFFGGVADLQTVSEAVFEECVGGDSPLFTVCSGWRGWPKDAKQDDVLSWITRLSDELAALAKPLMTTPMPRRRLLAQPNKPLQDSVAERKLDIGIVADPAAEEDSPYRWSQILVPGELKSNPSADIVSNTWRDLARYVREVLAAQDTRRFVLGFTLCGSLMRIWNFDRLGGIASEKFDINKDGLQFVSTILGFLWMNEEQLGFDPTITTEADRRILRIQRNGETERLVLDKLMKRAPCISGRATICWKAFREDDPQRLLVVKDSWQYTEREEEGELLQEATEKGVVNVARYYHHETVHVRSQIDDVMTNVRGELNITEAINFQARRPSESGAAGAKKGRSRSRSTTGLKRSSSQIGAPLPPSKRSCSTTSTTLGRESLPNRVHRRVIVRDYGKPIYKASSQSALLAALAGCIEGHESLHKAGFLHRDISINNLMINEDKGNPSWPSFLIDLDLAIRERRDGASGAKGKTGTRAFMAIGALFGEQHSFMHDLESFFWVLFWICIHCDGPDKTRVAPDFDKWNYAGTWELAILKLGTVTDETIFLQTMSDYFTPYYQPLIPLLSALRTVVFPGNKRWKREDEGLYSKMRTILQQESWS
ncbi:uncharacterized protein TRIREDRAFT_122898 [Trichoderma reesei QM6a]|uniref:non-specific serine/threonine protein kinase n=2 Tax=Hypocrea jecorina TaxID=51453 RepID=G0RPI2_HYPJQ|nr:uncharacterized protein TRIREDRAFT_122898 [Trichoderma reesei QM6a]EGR46861.1 predicted protein [Trichoderma reesei QM6a]ETS00418.1 hypothetical protein M419DRAFT_131554 [Trichoderma reesei RUT C-30]